MTRDAEADADANAAADAGADADADADASTDAARNTGTTIPSARTQTQTQTQTRTQTRTPQEPQSGGVCGTSFDFHSRHSSRHPSVAMASASLCGDFIASQPASSQSDTESVASPTVFLKQDLEGVEAHFRVLADSPGEG